MDSSKDRVVKVAKLSRLDLGEKKLDTFAAQFDDIVTLMDTLGEIDTNGVEPLYWPLAAPAAPPREDAVAHDNTRGELLRNAPEQDGQFFVVPRIV
jgi:aspartyl-tRNA(Asn)/glutamyl-tRNA(Gln) amidotransferase subunit C